MCLTHRDEADHWNFCGISHKTWWLSVSSYANYILYQTHLNLIHTSSEFWKDEDMFMENPEDCWHADSKNLWCLWNSLFIFHESNMTQTYNSGRSISNNWSDPVFFFLISFTTYLWQTGLFGCNSLKLWAVPLLQMLCV